jgi:hypothetical protein
MGPAAKNGAGADAPCRVETALQRHLARLHYRRAADWAHAHRLRGFGRHEGRLGEPARKAAARMSATFWSWLDKDGRQKTGADGKPVYAPPSSSHTVMMGGPNVAERRRIGASC